MRSIYVVICTFSLYLTIWTQNVSAATSNDRCTLPPSLSNEISQKSPGTHPVTLADLDEHSRKLFVKDHSNRCPGLVRINFYGDGKLTWVLVLVSGEPPKRKAELVTARQIAERWEIRHLDTTDGTPVVWSAAPGKYDGMSEPRTIRAKYPVIIFCGYESWSIAYAWTGKEVEKTWLSD